MPVISKLVKEINPSATLSKRGSKLAGKAVWF